MIVPIIYIDHALRRPTPLTPSRRRTAHHALANMQSLPEKASQWSGVDRADAFAIDTTNLFQKLGLQTFINLSTNFYNRF